MMRVCKSLIPAVLLALSACGSPPTPKPSAVEPAVTPPVVKDVKEDTQPAQVKDDTAKAAPAAAPKQPWNYNYALAANGATASGADKAALLIDGNFTVYDGAEGYAATDWSATPPQAMLITLKEAVDINTVRILLWDADPRYYRYKLEASSEAEGEKWTLLADCTKGEYRGWQLLPFTAQKVRRFKLTGTFDSANNYFHVVEFQAYFIPSGFIPRWNEAGDKPKATDSIGTTKDTF